MKLTFLPLNRGMLIGWILPCVICAALFPCIEGKANPAPATEPSSISAKHGSAIFHQRCIGCHQQQPNDSLPFGPPNLYMAFRGQSAISSHEAEAIITQGKGTMPAFGSVLSKSDIRSVIVYLRSK